MIPFRSIRSAIIQGLVSATGLPLVEMNDNGPVDTYPYITYDFVEFPGTVQGLPAETFDGAMKTFTETVEFTVSFHSYAAYKDESIENAMKVCEWLRTDGREILSASVNVVVIRVGPIQNRDIAIGSEWERRHGFDVEFRTMNTMQTSEYSIDSAEIQRR
ncbi:hypothetical protein [Paenibacillus sp. SI8]|uniref:phage neck terminator protein n=1 Tax=unclassified Paenibacillus TaxID=185978 RepID=UPI003465AF51